MKMLGAAIFISVLYGVAVASDEFSVLVSPKSLAFKGEEKLNSEALGDVYAASLGRSVSGNSQWSGLYINDPFDLPESAIAVIVDGVDHLKFSDKAKTFRITGSGVGESLHALSSTVDVADVDLNEGVDKIEQLGDVFDGAGIPDIPKETTSLKPQLHSEDKLFLQQVAVLKSLAKSSATQGNLPSLAIFRLSLAPLRSAHGKKSPAVYEAERLVTEVLENLASSANAANTNVLITVITHNDSDMLRHKRQTEQSKISASDINVAAYYSEDYPVIFNIILWFMIVLAFSLLAISYAIATMDPGRDSIIYRMTSTRMKKDN